MKILLCHNFYQQPGGEDQVFADESWLLESHGHNVVRYTVHNDSINSMNRWHVAKQTFWNRGTYKRLRELIRAERPRLMHCTNTFPLISPAAYAAARDEGVPVVQSLHNYRLQCTNGCFFRDGKVCEDCLGKTVAWGGVVRGCYRENRAASAVVALAHGFHKAKGTWDNAVDLYVTVSEFSRRKFIEGGLPEHKIVVKPNFIHPDPGPGKGQGGYAVYVGRLSPEKGISTLLDAWRRLPSALPLKILGDGPLAEQVRQAAQSDDRIEWLGRRPLGEVCAIVGDASFLLMTSVWYETFGRTMAEAFAVGTPVIASRLGAMTELVEDGQTGLLFAPGDASDLVAKIQRLSADERLCWSMRETCRAEYEAKYTAERNYPLLLDIYGQVLDKAAARPAIDSIASQATEEHVQRPARVSIGDDAGQVAWPSKVNLLGVEVSQTNYDDAAAVIVRAARNKVPAVVSCQAVHAVVTSSCDAALCNKVNEFEMVTPDGQPVRWAMNLLHRTGLEERVYGPELMLRLCRRAAKEGVSIYLYGGANGHVIGKLCENLLKACPGLQIAGCESPPFRELTAEEDDVVVQRINASGAGLVFIGLGFPKQDLFAHAHRGRIQAVQVCVGAAFDFHAGVKPMAPQWMQRHGLEWAFRLLHEPRRLFRRYLVTNSLFVTKTALAFCRVRGGSPQRARVRVQDRQPIDR